MKLINIECKHKGNVVVNTDHICSIADYNGIVLVTTSDGKEVYTKFTDAQHAVDYIIKAIPFNQSSEYRKVVDSDWSE